MFDAIVVGSGPAGATAAYFLSQAGGRVLVVEKARLPRYKACGGGLSVGMLGAHFPFSFDPIIEARVRRVALALGDRVVHTQLQNDSVCTVMRDRLDQHILSHSGAEVLQGVTVDRVEEDHDRVRVGTKDGRLFEARHVVGADGANSVVARAMGLRRGKLTAGAIEVEAPVEPEAMKVFEDALWFVFGELPLGYLWMFPKADHLSVGIGALHPRPGQLQATLKRVMARYGVSLEGMPLHGHPIPIYSRRERLATRRVALVGDAAGLADPVTGEGIRLAIKSGRLAAEVIQTDRLDRYNSLVFHHIGRSHALGLVLAWLFYTFPDFWFRVGAANPLVSHVFAEMLSDRADYAATALTVFGSTPGYMALEVVLGFLRAFLGPERARQLREAASLGTATSPMGPAWRTHGGLPVSRSEM
ncbi:MAG TPA: NAD(P)/FAD-dependent oxidoreductase [Anaerolineales bacterium]|nr:NAD(P)/FAD-dependent oxidoreductase [Anaerolineales bacterium]